MSLTRKDLIDLLELGPTLVNFVTRIKDHDAEQRAEIERLTADLAASRQALAVYTADVNWRGYIIKRKD